MSTGIGARQRDLLAALATTTYSSGGRFDNPESTYLPVMAFLHVPDTVPDGCVATMWVTARLSRTETGSLTPTASANRRALTGLAERGLIDEYRHRLTFRVEPEDADGNPATTGECLKVSAWVGINDAGLTELRRHGISRDPVVPTASG
jgi:hypothetical protein